MTDTEFRMWKDRLRVADRVWAGHGLIADRVGADSIGIEEIWTYIRSYRGDQWNGSWGGIPAGQLAVTTLFFSSMNRWSAGLLSRNPRVQVLPLSRSGTQHARDVAVDALAVQTLLDHDVRVQKMFRQWNAAQRDSFFSPLGGIIRHGFTPSDEHHHTDSGDLIQNYTMAEPDRPWIRRVAPWDVRIDPAASTFASDEDARWCAFRHLYTVDEIKDNPGLTARDDLRPTTRMTFEGVGGVSRRLRRTSGDDFDRVETWVVYDKVERKWFEISNGSDKPIREPDDWPDAFNGFNDLPYDQLTYNSQMDSPFQVPYAASIAPACHEHRKLRTILMELAKRLRRLVILNKSAIDEDDYKKITEQIDLMEFISTRDGAPPGEAMQQVQIGGIDTSILALDNQYVQDVREALGQSQMDRAQRINVETATEANFVEQGSYAANARDQVATEDFLGSSIRHYAKARQATAGDDPTIVPIVGQEDAAALLDSKGAQWATVSADQLKGEWFFEIRTGSTLPRDRAKEAQRALARLQVATNPAVAPMLKGGQFVMDWVISEGLNPVSAMKTAQETAQQQTAQQSREAGGAAPPPASPDQSNLIGMLDKLNGGGGQQ